MIRLPSAVYRVYSEVFIAFLFSYVAMLLESLLERFDGQGLVIVEALGDPAAVVPQDLHRSMISTICSKWNSRNHPNKQHRVLFELRQHAGGILCLQRLIQRTVGGLIIGVDVEYAQDPQGENGQDPPEDEAQVQHE